VEGEYSGKIIREFGVKRKAQNVTTVTRHT
jgi:hypothetical protein